jgi:hypothetical protein
MVIDESEVLQGGDDVVLLDGRGLAKLVDGDLRLRRRGVPVVRLDVGLRVQQHLGPIRLF